MDVVQTDDKACGWHHIALAITYGQFGLTASGAAEILFAVLKGCKKIAAESAARRATP